MIKYHIINSEIPNEIFILMTDCYTQYISVEVSIHILYELKAADDAYRCYYIDLGGCLVEDVKV